MSRGGLKRYNVAAIRRAHRLRGRGGFGIGRPFSWPLDRRTLKTRMPQVAELRGLLSRGLVRVRLCSVGLSNVLRHVLIRIRGLCWIGCHARRIRRRRGRFSSRFRRLRRC